MKILAYRGKSLISKAIRFQTRSKYSHIAVMLDDGSVIEAWHKGGVRKSPSPSTLHSPGTKVDVFRIDAKFDKDTANRFLHEQVGKKYDFKSVARFLSRRKTRHNNKYFCSELAEFALAFGGLLLLNGNPSEHSPRDTVLSPHLILEDQIITD